MPSIVCLSSWPKELSRLVLRVSGFFGISGGFLSIELVVFSILRVFDAEFRNV